MTQYVLEILDGDRAGETVPLGTEPLTIGRKPANTLRLADEKVSGEHATIVLEGDRYVLRDLKSTNGTLLDGRRIDEVALTPFDTFQVGRVRVVFKEEGAASPEAALQVHRLDTARAGRRRGGAGVLLAAVVAAAGAGAWFYLQGDAARTEGGGRAQPVLEIAGNRLPVAAASCEDGEGWDLRVAGASFDLDGVANSGTGSLYAALLADEDAPVSAGFALARTAEPANVLSGRGVRATAFARTEGGARAALRLRFTSSTDEFEPIWAGAAPATSEAFAEIALEVPVPDGMDRVEVELLAELPSEDAAAWFDDVALVDVQADGGALRAGACQLVCTGADLALRSGNDVLVYAARPIGAVEGPAPRLISDLGGALAATAVDGGFSVAVSGIDGVELDFAVEAAAGLRVAADGAAFAARSGDLELAGGSALLLGSGPTRALVRSPGASAIRTELRSDRFAVRFVGATELRFAVEFEQERAVAREALRAARGLAEGSPGRAIDALTKLASQWPHDREVLGEAERLRGELMLAARQEADALASEADDAEFFDGRRAFGRVRRGLTRLVDRYGAHNLPESVPPLLASVEARLQAFAAADGERRRAELETLATVLSQSGDAGLLALVRSHLGQ